MYPPICGPNFDHAHSCTAFQQVRHSTYGKFPSLKSQRSTPPSLCRLGDFTSTVSLWVNPFAPEHIQNRMVTEVTAGLESSGCLQRSSMMSWSGQKRQLSHSTCQSVSLGNERLHFLATSSQLTARGKTWTRALQDMRDITNVSELRSFLGMVNQLWKFIPNSVVPVHTSVQLIQMKMNYFTFICSVFFYWHGYDLDDKIAIMYSVINRCCQIMIDRF